MIQLKHIYKTYHADKHVLRDLNFEPKTSDFYIVTGPSGSGKTTLFKILSLLTTPTSGDVLFNNKSILSMSQSGKSILRQKIGIVFQDFKLIEDMTLLENMILPLIIQKKSESEIKSKIDFYSDVLDIKDILSEYPQFVSGGQQQRVAVARALINDPKLILADEPTGNLDYSNSEIILNLLQEKAKAGASIILSTHDENILKKRLGFYMQLHDGRLKA